MFEWHFLSRDTWSLYVDFGCGMLGTTEPVPFDGSQFNFTPQAGLGATMDIGQNRRWLIGVRWFHISNASLYANNPGPRQHHGVHRTQSALLIFLKKRPPAVQPFQRWKTSDTLCPPNPNVLLTATSTCDARASLGTKSKSIPSSGLSRLIVGGSTPWCSASTVATDSMPPAAPRA